MSVGANDEAPENGGLSVPRGRVVVAVYAPGQTAGRSAAAPVHWPLCPPPLPPFVGGDGFANAGTAVATPNTAPVTTMARRSFMKPSYFLLAGNWRSSQTFQPATITQPRATKNRHLGEIFRMGIVMAMHHPSGNSGYKRCRTPMSPALVPVGGDDEAPE
jgi:hypothetical protein